MGSITNFLEQELLDHVCNASYTAPTNLYLCLCTADPTDAATGASMNEVANANGYARTEITFAVAASRAVDQDAAVNFPQASGGGWGTVSHWCIASASGYGGGDALAHGAFSTSKTINDGDTPSVASGEIDVTYTAGEISNHLAEELLDHVFNNAAYTSPDTYLALFTTDCSDSTPGTEVSGGSYARVQINPNAGSAPKWDLAVSGDPSYVDNAGDVSFPTASADWGTVVSMAVMDAVTSGNMLFYDNAMTDKAVNNGDTAKFPAGDLDFQMS